MATIAADPRGMRPSFHGYRSHVIRRTAPDEPGANGPTAQGGESVKRIRVEKPKPRRPRELELPPPLDPRDPDVVRVKRGGAWRFADRRWAL